jgi:hypothetical protein
MIIPSALQTTTEFIGRPAELGPIILGTSDLCPVPILTPLLQRMTHHASPDGKFSHHNCCLISDIPQSFRSKYPLPWY